MIYMIQTSEQTKTERKKLERKICDDFEEGISVKY
jgi:hypothetical protein